MKNIYKLIISIVGCELAGMIGSIFTMPAITSWYQTLQKPAFNPPNWIFGPVWTLLYLLMGVSFYLIWKKGFKKDENREAGIFFGIQLALNILWSILFFGFHSPAAAFFNIMLLWICIMAMIFSFMRISKTAAFIQLPYLFWVSFASVLNYFIWQLNL